MNNFEVHKTGFLKALSKEFRFRSNEAQHKITNLKNLYDKSGHLNEIGKHIFESNGQKVNKEEHIESLRTILDNASPFIYLGPEQKSHLINDIEFYHFTKRTLLYSDTKESENLENASFILIKGEALFFDLKQVFQDMLTNNCLFGYDGPIFHKRRNSVIVEKGTVLAIISESGFIENIKPFSKFCTYVSNTIIHKDKILDSLANYRELILNSIDKGSLKIDKVLNLYTNMKPCLHPKVNSDDIDFSAWLYSLNRLPDTIHESFVFILINRPPKLLSTREQLCKEKMPFVKTKARNRDVYKYLHGKNLVLAREIETDVLDFVSNMCIHIIESRKIRKAINSPIVIEKIYDHRDSFDECISVLKNDCNIEIEHENQKALKTLYGNKFADVLIDICLHYQDYHIQITKVEQIDNNPIDSWTQNLWITTKALLNVNSTVEEIDDLVVDIFQGSKRTLLGTISPHLYMHKEDILKWGKETNIQLKTKIFATESDLLLAYSYYYYKQFPDKQKEKNEVDNKHGIQIIKNTFSTGVQVVLINPNLLNPDYVDPCLKLKPASKNHLILHIGYTFGAQAGHIIRPLLMLFGSKARSLNIIGKAGALIGNRTDILIANNIFYDKTHEISNVNTGKLDEENLKKEIGADIHIGPMLTVAGTILQNNDLLNFYKYVKGCIGLEMEGYFYVKEVENAIKMGIIRPDFITRCFYYASDLPLDPTQNLAMEEGNVSWDEGVGSMNAIQRYIMKEIFS
jgi:hypothetical protein